jgi:S-adenosylmethionine:tRNA ribosyltransferase-isomerase
MNPTRRTDVPPVLISPARTSDFDYPLPAELIAQEPVPARDQSRLLVVSRQGEPLAHRRFADLPEYLREGDVLVLNDSRVIPARLRGQNACTGGQFELLLLEENAPNDWWAMVRPGKRARVGTEILLREPDGSPLPSDGRGGRGEGGKSRSLSASGLAEPPHPSPLPRWGRGGTPTGKRIPAEAHPDICARVVAANPEGQRRLVFSGTNDILAELDQIGEVPLPPYIQRNVPNLRSEDRDRYQTVYACAKGSVAAPTAGLHFTDALLESIRRLGVEVCTLTLHVGLGTFAPVKTQTLEGHVMHEERFHVGAETARRVNLARQEGRRVIAIGTTTVRVLESLAATGQGHIQAGEGRTRIFIHPPFHFRMVDALVTNFHLPCSTLLMLVSAFAAPGATEGRRLILDAYAEAVRERYRFFSYGDAMLLDRTDVKWEE